MRLGRREEGRAAAPGIYASRRRLVVEQVCQLFVGCAEDPRVSGQNDAVSFNLILSKVDLKSKPRAIDQQICPRSWHSAPSVAHPDL